MAGDARFVQKNRRKRLPTFVLQDKTALLVKVKFRLAELHISLKGHLTCYLVSFRRDCGFKYHMSQAMFFQNV